MGTGPFRGRLGDGKPCVFAALQDFVEDGRDDPRLFFLPLFLAFWTSACARGISWLRKPSATSNIGCQWGWCGTRGMLPHAWIGRQHR